VCALFNDLHDVAQVLSEHIREETGIQDVQAGQPRDVDATTEPAARITLLYTTPQPGHRNDPLEPASGGGMRPPPLSLSCFYLVTTSGSDTEDPIGAHHALGRVMGLYHDVPTLHLPLSANPGSPPGVFTDLGSGELSVTQVPMALDQIDHVWMPLTDKLQPWVLFEVAPVQLISNLPDTAAPPVVRPGGIVLEQPIGLRPAVLDTSPQPARPDGRLRLEVAAAQEVDGVWVDELRIAPGDAALTVAASASGTTTVLVDLSKSGLSVLTAGAHSLTVSAGGLASRTTTVQLLDGLAVLDAPAEAAHDPSADLVLTGSGLGAVQEVVTWPARGIGAPSDVRSLPFASGGAGKITVRSAGGLAGLPAAITSWRLAAQLPGPGYTPYVALEVAR
jgi:hypothetical protein